LTTTAKTRVFVVEDEALIAMQLSDCLKQMGYEICGRATTGEKALVEISRTLPDLILMDIRLGGKLSGIETSLQLRRFMDAPVVFLSAFSDERLIREAIGSEPFGYLVKPFEASELHATLQAALHKHRAEQILRADKNRLEEAIQERTAELRRSEAELRELNASLEQIVAERTGELHKSEEQLKYALGATSDGLWDWDLKTGNVYYSPQWVRLLGYSPEEVPQRIEFYLTVVHPDDLSPLMQVMEDHLAGRVSVKEIDIRLRTKSGDYLWVRDRGSVVATDENGKASRMVGTITDITERKQAEEALHARERQNAALLNAIPDLMFRINRAGIFLDYWAQSASDLFVPPDKIIGGNIRELMPPGNAELALEHIHATLETGEVEVFEFSLTVPRGPRQYEARMAPSGADEVVSIVRDITERKAAEEKLSESNRQLTTALDQLKQAQSEMIEHERLRTLGQMAAGIAHNFNNALSPIVGLCELMLDQPEMRQDQQKVTQYLQMILQSANDAAGVVRHLRELYRRPEKYQTLQAVNLSHVVEQVVAMTEPRWKQQTQSAGKPVEIEMDLADVPAIAGNEGELREVLTNLIFNAIESMPQGGTIHLSTRQQEQSVVLKIRDTGIGMTDDVRQHCFDAFFTTKNTQGTGLGLATVMSIVRQHEGTIDLQTAPNQGATFTILLPIRTALAAPERASTLKDSGKRGRILIVEDEPAIRTIYANYLTQQGHTVVTAANGRAGLEAFCIGEFDIVISDMAMPEMNGEQLAMEIHRLASRTPVILLTGFGDIMNARGERPAGITAVIAKPVNLKDLRTVVLNALALRDRKE
jgi:PAS domain S-box-containing protein